MSEAVGGSPINPQYPVQKDRLSAQSEEKKGPKTEKEAEVDRISQEILKKQSAPSHQEPKATLAERDISLKQKSEVPSEILSNLSSKKLAALEDAKIKAESERFFSKGIKHWRETHGFDPSIPEDKAMLFELAKIAAANDSIFPHRIKDFGFDPLNPEDKAMSFELAKISAANELNFSYTIKNFGFDPLIPEDEAQIFEIAKIFAANNPIISSKIKDFGFSPLIPKDKAKILELAKIAIANYPTFQHKIKDFGLDLLIPEDKAKILELAKIALASNKENFTDITNFGFDPSIFEEKAMLFEIAKSEKNDPAIVRNIRSFSLNPSILEDKSLLFEIAMIHAASMNSQISTYISRFGFNSSIQEEHELLFKIAKMAAANDPTFSRDVQSYGFFSKEDKSNLFELAQIALASNNLKLNYINQFGFDPSILEEKAMLFEIAKIAKNDPEIVQNIKSFHLNPAIPEDKSLLFEIAMMSATSTHSEISKYINNFGFNPSIQEDHEMLFKIAKTAARHTDVNRVHEFNISNFINLSNPKQHDMLIPLFNILFLKNPTETIKLFHLLDNESFSHNKSLQTFKFIHSMLTTEDIPKYLDLLKPLLAKSPQLLSTLKNQTDPRLKKSALNLFGLIASKSLLAKDPELFFQNLNKLELVSLLEKVYDPSLRLSLISCIGEEMGLSELPKTDKPLYQLPILLLYSVAAQDLNPQLLSKTEHAIVNLKTHLKDGNLSKALLNALLTLNDTQFFSNEEVCQLIEISLNNPKSFTVTLRQLKMLKAIMDLDGKDLLKRELASGKVDFPLILEEAFKRKVPLLANETGFAEKLLNTFQASRRPNAIYEYVATLSKFQYEPTQQALGTFILSVLNGTFLTERMSLENNWHLKTLHDKYPELFAAWAKGGSMPKEVRIEAEGLKPIPLNQQLQTFFFNKLITDKHLEEMNLTLFKKFLNTESKNEKNDIQKMIEKLDDSESSQLQKIFIQIAHPNFASFKSSKQKELMDQVEGLVPTTSLFKNDMPLLKEIIEGKNKLETGRLILLSTTNNPYDLLLCGTEVPGSCQAIDGNPEANRGLLGYLLNGHLMIEAKAAGKNPDQEPIIGRAIFRLEFDPEDKPILLLERIYPQNLPPAYKDELKIYARELAADHYSQFVEGGEKIPLVSAEEGDSSRPFNKEVRSLGGRVDEYVDSANGMSPEAVYTIRNACYV